MSQQRPRTVPVVKVTNRGGVPAELWLPSSATDILGHRNVAIERDLTPDEAGETTIGQPRYGWRVTLHGGPYGAEPGNLIGGPVGALWIPDPPPES